ncbi:MAG: ABC transporter permease [Treponema sp.]|nr:ABC transporter permease [Treponema sp.]
MQVHNTPVIRKTAQKYIFKNRGKSFVIILSIALCTFLFTTLFTVGGSILRMLKESTQRQIGTTAAGAFKYLNQEEYDRLDADPKLKEVSHWICVGEAANKELLKVRTEVHWSDEISAKKGFCYPEAGALPQTENEAAFSSLVLEALKIDVDPSNFEALLGKKISLIVEINDRIIQKDFTISGVFTGDRVAMSQVVLVSKAFQEKYAPVPVLSYYGNQADFGFQIGGFINADIDFYNPFGTERQLVAAIFRDGLPEDVEIGVSNASVTGTMDGTTLLLVVFLLITIFLSGYLIINNIYRINVYSDIRSYGLLKTIGMSGRQLSSLVRYQAVYLSLPGILAGILAGTLVGTLLIPVIVKMLNISTTAKGVIHINGLVLLVSALFSFMTVIVSCRRPARLASKVSPIEAVRYTETARGKKIPKRIRDDTASTHSHTRFTNLSFAGKNLSRDKKKVFWVVLSLSLSLVILNTVYTLLHGFSEDKYVSASIATDFSVADATLDNPSIRNDNRNTTGISNELLNELNNLPGVEEIGNIYLESTYQHFTDEDFQKIDERLLNKPFMQTLTSYGDDIPVKDMYEEYRASPVNLYGMDDFVLKNLPVRHGQIDLEKFKTGNYILVNEYDMRLPSGESPVQYFLPGEKISVTTNEGITKQYEVMATVVLPYAFRLQIYDTLDMFYILPTSEFNSFCGARSPMRCLFNSTDAQEQNIEKWLETYTTETEPLLTYKSRDVYKQEFKSLTSMLILTGGLLTGILALIGLLNLINTMTTSIISRRLELAMLEAVGMTKRTQINGMCIEGVLYATLTGIAGIILSGLFSAILIRPLSHEMWFFDWSFTLLPVSVVFPIMIVLTLLLPVVIYKKVMSTSVVERLRIAEV